MDIKLYENNRSWLQTHEKKKNVDVSFSCKKIHSILSLSVGQRHPLITIDTKHNRTRKMKSHCFLSHSGLRCVVWVVADVAYVLQSLQTIIYSIFFFDSISSLSWYITIEPSSLPTADEALNTSKLVCLRLSRE